LRRELRTASRRHEQECGHTPSGASLYVGSDEENLPVVVLASRVARQRGLAAARSGENLDRLLSCRGEVRSRGCESRFWIVARVVAADDRGQGDERQSESHHGSPVMEARVLSNAN
jgi:hypothetical protein